MQDPDPNCRHCGILAFLPKSLIRNQIRFFRFYPTFRLFLTFRLSDSTALVEIVWWLGPRFILTVGLKQDFCLNFVFSTMKVDLFFFFPVYLCHTICNILWPDRQLITFICIPGDWRDTSDVTYFFNFAGAQTLFPRKFPHSEQFVLHKAERSLLYLEQVFLFLFFFKSR